MLELLILKALYGWLDYNFNDVLQLLSWYLPQPNYVATNTYQANKVISLLTIGFVKCTHAKKNPSFTALIHSMIWTNALDFVQASVRIMSLTLGINLLAVPPLRGRGEKKLVHI